MTPIACKARFWAGFGFEFAILPADTDMVNKRCHDQTNACKPSVQQNTDGGLYLAYCDWTRHSRGRAYSILRLALRSTSLRFSGLTCLSTEKKYVNSSLTEEFDGPGRIDEQLLPYLNCRDNTQTEEHLQRLLEKAQPIVYRIARSMRVGATQSAVPFNTQDIFGDVCVRLLQSLRTFKNGPHQHPISNFSGLVATTTSSVFADLLRGRDRQRRSLYQKIRRLIAANPKLATWKDNDGSLVCGYAAWRSAKVNAVSVPSQMKLDFQSGQLEQGHKRNTAELILLVLSNVGRPIKFDQFVDLVNIASAGVQVQTISIEDEHYVQSSPLVSYQPDFIASVENQNLLSRLFAEIGTLRVEQRKSLLLNMTDSYGFGIEWFLFTKIATEEHLAKLLEVSIEQFRKMLNDLPMSDAEIGRDLGLSQSRVMNMRRAVRERLDRRRRDFLGEGSSDSMRLK